MTDLIILATLLSSPKHGYQLKHEAGMILGQAVLHNNLVYPLLRRFMHEKWVSRKTVPGERGQRRHEYSITARGRRELLMRLSTFGEQDARSSDGFRVRVALFQLLDSEVRTRILDGRDKFLRARIEKLTTVETNFQLNGYAKEVVSQFRKDTQSELHWIGRLRRWQKGAQAIRDCAISN